MGDGTSIDYYEILEISPNANSETIDRVFRFLARRYHPDNQETGDAARFSDIVQAHNTLKDSAKRAQYDIQHKDRLSIHRKLAEETNDPKGIKRDADIQDLLLSLLYVRRRQNINEPGLGNLELERLSGTPREHLDFHLWYLKEKGWIKMLDTGLLAITAEGVDRANVGQQQKATIKLLKDETAPIMV